MESEIIIVVAFSKKNKAIKISSHIKYDELVNRLYRVLRVDQNIHELQLSYKATTSGTVVEICDDDDVEIFCDISKSKIDDLMILKVSTVAKNSSGVGRNRASNLMSASGSNQAVQSMPVFQSYNPSFNEPVMCDTEVQAPNESSVGLEDIQTGSVWGINNEYQTYGEYCNVDADAGERDPDSHEDHYDGFDIPTGFNEPINVIHPNIQMRDAFFGMAPLPDDPILIGEAGPSHSGQDFYVKQIFSTKQTLQDALGYDALNKGYQYKVSRSSKSRWEVNCINDSCKWRLRATKLEDSECFQIRKFEDSHTCPRDQVMPYHKHATPRILGQWVKKKYEASSHDRVIRANDVQGDFREFFKIDLTYAQAWKARNWALNELRGSPEESFAILPDFYHMLEQTNPGTVTHIETDEFNHFKYCFMAMGQSIRAFRESIRPVICVDGAHLKGKYLGTMFIAVALDGNNQIYPLAFGVGDSENDASWGWFLTNLRDDVIGSVDNLVFISDRHRSIEKGIHNIFPNAYHGACCHHLKMNMRAKWSKQTDKISDLYWGAAKAYRLSDFREKMNELRSISLDAYKYLEEIGFHKWSRSHFPGRRYNIMTTNLAESFNNVTKDARSHPITQLMEFVRATIQKWFH